jgi:hypothetical protein
MIELGQLGLKADDVPPRSAGSLVGSYRSMMT